MVNIKLPLLRLSVKSFLLAKIKPTRRPCVINSCKGYCLREVRCNGKLDLELHSVAGGLHPFSHMLLFPFLSFF